VRGPSKTIDATVLTAAIGIDGLLKRHIRRLIPRNDGTSLFPMQASFFRRRAHRISFRIVLPQGLVELSQ